MTSVHYRQVVQPRINSFNRDQYFQIWFAVIQCTSILFEASVQQICERAMLSASMAVYAILLPVDCLEITLSELKNVESHIRYSVQLTSP